MSREDERLSFIEAVWPSLDSFRNLKPESWIGATGAGTRGRMMAALGCAKIESPGNLIATMRLWSLAVGVGAFVHNPIFDHLLHTSRDLSSISQTTFLPPKTLRRYCNRGATPILCRYYKWPVGVI